MALLPSSLTGRVPRSLGQVARPDFHNFQGPPGGDYVRYVDDLLAWTAQEQLRARLSAAAATTAAAAARAADAARNSQTRTSTTATAVPSPAAARAPRAASASAALETTGWGREVLNLLPGQGGAADRAGRAGPPAQGGQSRQPSPSSPARSPRAAPTAPWATSPLHTSGDGFARSADPVAAAPTLAPGEQARPSVSGAAGNMADAARALWARANPASPSSASAGAAIPRSGTTLGAEGGGRPAPAGKGKKGMPPVLLLVLFVGLVAVGQFAPGLLPVALIAWVAYNVWRTVRAASGGGKR